MAVLLDQVKELKSQNEELGKENARLHAGIGLDRDERAMQGSSPSQVPKGSICSHCKQTGRCRFAGAGLGCLEGTHPVELGKARDTAVGKSNSQDGGDKMELVYASR
jgi:hypothetical protein